MIGVAALFYCSAVHFYCSTTDQQWGCVSVSLPCVSATEQQARPAIFFTSNSAALLVADLIFCTTESFRAPLCLLQLPNLEKGTGTEHWGRGHILSNPTPIQPLRRGGHIQPILWLVLIVLAPAKGRQRPKGLSKYENYFQYSSRNLPLVNWP